MASPTLRSNVFSRSTGLIIEGRTARLDFCGLQSNGGHMDDDRNAPASKGDLAEQGALFKEDLAELETRITARFKADLAEQGTRFTADLAERETRMVDRLTEVMRDAQTETLKAFYGFVAVSY